MLFMFFYTFEVGPIAAVFGGAVSVVAGIAYGIAAAMAVTGTAAVGTAVVGTGAGAAAEVTVGTTAVVATGTGAGVAGGAATGAAGKMGLAVAGTGVGVGLLFVGMKACRTLWKKFCNWSALLQQVETEIGQELQELNRRLKEKGFDAEYVRSRPNVRNG